MKMGCPLYKKVEEVRAKFCEYYGAGIDEDFSISEEAYNRFYEVNTLLINILDDVEMESYEGTEE